MATHGTSAIFTNRDLFYKTQGTKLTREFRNFIDEKKRPKLYNLVTDIVFDFRIFQEDSIKEEKNPLSSLTRLESKIQDISRSNQKNELLLDAFKTYRISLFKELELMF